MKNAYIDRSCWILICVNISEEQLSYHCLVSCNFWRTYCRYQHINSKHICSVQAPICPASHVQHWDKIVFFIKSPNLAGNLHLVPETEYDIKVLDDPHKVADIKQKVLDFLNVPNEPRDSIHILEVGYAMICAE